MKQALLFVLLIGCSSAVAAQDFQLSQFFAAPLALNPALTGAFPGRYRVGIVNRSQWGQVLDKPFSTTAFSADFRYYVNPAKRRYKDAFGVGVIFSSDRVSDINFSTNQIMISGAFHKALDAKNNQSLSLGVQFGVVQRNVSYDQLTFEDAFNGTDTYVTGATGEELPENNFAFGDYQIGLSYSYAPKRSTAFTVGAALHHVNQPEQSFYFTATQGEDIEVTNLLHRRYSAYLNISIPLTREIDLSPRLYAFAQGPHLAANAGANLRFLVNDSNGTALHVGAYFRPVQSEDDFGLDSAVGLVGIEYESFLFGFSYDAGLNGLVTNPRHRGTYEFSVVFLGKADDDETVPCFRF